MTATATSAVNPKAAQLPEESLDGKGGVLCAVANRVLELVEGSTSSNSRDPHSRKTRIGAAIRDLYVPAVAQKLSGIDLATQIFTVSDPPGPTRCTVPSSCQTERVKHQREVLNGVRPRGSDTGARFFMVSDPEGQTPARGSPCCQSERVKHRREVLHGV